jgi:hypothetical protein
MSAAIDLHPDQMLSDEPRFRELDAAVFLTDLESEGEGHVPVPVVSAAFAEAYASTARTLDQRLPAAFNPYGDREATRRPNTAPAIAGEVSA